MGDIFLLVTSAMNLEIELREPPAPRTFRGLHRVRECRVCMGEHEEEVHEATLRVRARFRDEVTRYLDLEVPLIA